MPYKPITLTCVRCGKTYKRSPTRPVIRTFCSTTCRYAGPLTDLATRFWAKVDKRGPDECWPWLASARNRQGHGGAWDGNRWTHAHRIAYRLTNGTIPRGMQVCHHCDNPPCCNPAHLFLGTARDNMADMDRKGRRVNAQATGTLSGRSLHPERYPVGAAVANSVLTDNDVRYIRANYVPRGKPSQYDLAAQFGVSQLTISRIIRRLAWSHVDT